MGVAFAVGGSQPRFGRNANTGGDIGAETRLEPSLGDLCITASERPDWVEWAWGTILNPHPWIPARGPE